MATVFKSYLNDVMRDIGKGIAKQRAAAARHITKEIRVEARKHKDTGEYQKGIYTKNTRSASYFGVKAPHAYLVEFGTLTRYKNSTGQEVGAMPALGIVYGTAEREKDTAEKIMSEPYIK